MPTRRALTRRTLLAGAAIALAGCGNGAEDAGDGSGDGGDTDTTQPADGGGTGPATYGAEDIGVTGDVTQTGDLTLTSPAFADGEQIPLQYGYNRENVNPPLEIADVPEAADSFALLVDDPDAVEPAGTVWEHWLVWNISPGTRSIPEDWAVADAEEGTTDFDEVGYGGPSPPDTEHTYRFKLFALDTTLSLSSSADGDALAAAMDGHILAATQLEGTYPADA